MYRFVRAGAALLVLIAVLWGGSTRFGLIPPIAPLLDPAHGAWSAAAQVHHPRRETLTLRGLRAPVDVRIDSRDVPHIFATNEPDVYRALGYLTARDRLFQLELQSRAAAGRLTELLGSRTLDLDREMRRLGLPRAAERKLAGMDTMSAEWKAIVAYGQGINDYIDGLTPADLPIEYHLLGARPSRWEPINSVHLLNRMGWTLASDAPELARLRAAATIGEAAAKALFPVASPIEEPIQPSGQWGPQFRITSIPPPATGDSATRAMVAALPTARNGDEEQFQASNNWAVAPWRTKDKHALLAGDPHLTLTLPSIWYEAHLVVPGRLDVYGVTLPGAPVVVIGFNRDVAWTFTNTNADVMDFYRETVDDAGHPTKYLLDRAWHPLEERIEKYRDPSGHVIHVDTIYFSHRGPLTHPFSPGRDQKVGTLQTPRQPPTNWMSMRWTVLESSSELHAFLTGMHARSANEFQQAMGASFFAPAQNMLSADRGGHIALRSTGHFPIRPNHGDGLTIRDGASSASDWTGYWPVDRYPQAFDPPQGYVASANQEPLSPERSFAYLGAESSFIPWRAMRINTLLRDNRAVTMDDMRKYQTDPGSARADLFVPYFLNAARRSNDTALVHAAALLARWDRKYTKGNERAVLFEAAMRRLVDLTWDELLSPDGRTRAATPSTAMLYALLQQPSNRWWDDRRTPDVEDRDALLRRSLGDAYADVMHEHGAPERPAWRWGEVQQMNIYHLLRIPAFSILGIPMQGGPSTLSPLSGDGTHGASWRMVVELGPNVRGWATYPGGQSGNPVSPRYRDHMELWERGGLDPLLFPTTVQALPPRQTSAAITLVPAEKR